MFRGLHPRILILPLIILVSVAVGGAVSRLHQEKYGGVELSNFLAHYTVFWNQSLYDDFKQLDQFLDQAKVQGGKEIILSVSWADVEKSKDKYDYSYIDERADKIIEKGLRLTLILDAASEVGPFSIKSTNARPSGYFAIPSYIWADYPDCKVADFDGNQHSHISFAHEDCASKALKFFRDASKHFSEKYGDRIVAFQPAFSQEYEVKYNQEGYLWQDYSDISKEDFRDWLRSQNSDSRYWGERWGMTIKDFKEILPPRVDYNRDSEPDPYQIFYDWQRYREEKLVSVHILAARAIHNGGGKVLYHFGEWGNSNDAIYVSPIIPLVLSGAVDYIVVDSNLMDSKLNKHDPIVSAIILSASRRFNKSIRFEAAVERLSLNSSSDQRLITKSLINAVKAGASGIALTNINDLELAGRLLSNNYVNTLPEGAFCSQVIYRSRWQYYAYHGASAQKGNTRKDPLALSLFALYKNLLRNGCVEIWDDELMTVDNLLSIKTLILTGASVIKEETLKMWPRQKRGGCVLFGTMQSARISLPRTSC